MNVMHLNSPRVQHSIKMIWQYKIYGCGIKLKENTQIYPYTTFIHNWIVLYNQNSFFSPLKREIVMEIIVSPELVVVVEVK